MAASTDAARQDVRYEPDERPPNLLCLGLGLQYAMMAVPSIVLGPTVMIQLAGGGDAYLTWAVCAALVISGGRSLLLIARGEGDGAVLEFIAATDAANLEDRMALLGQPAAGGPVEQEVSLRLLRHYASSVRHYQYQDTDVVTVRVEAARG